MAKTIAVDSRGRTNLGRSAREGAYRLTERPDGALLLEPVRVLTEAEIADLRRRNVETAIDQTHAGTAETVERSW
jgi:hypothetical protein